MEGFEININEYCKESANTNNDLLNTPIEETAEFTVPCPSSDPTKHVDPAASGEHGVAVPGGLKETPNAKPAGGEQGPAIPGGDKETPNAKPADAASVPVPKNATMTSDAYNDALTRLQKSFKEMAETFDLLAGANVLQESTEDQAIRLANEASDAAWLEAVESGPLFEATKEDEKENIKAATAEVRKKANAEFKNAGKCFYKADKVAKLISDSCKKCGEAVDANFFKLVGIAGGTKEEVDKIAAELAKKVGDGLKGFTIFASELGEGAVAVLKCKCKDCEAGKACLITVGKTEPKAFVNAVNKLKAE